MTVPLQVFFLSLPVPVLFFINYLVSTSGVSSSELKAMIPSILKQVPVFYQIIVIFIVNLSEWVDAWTKCGYPVVNLVRTCDCWLRRWILEWYDYHIETFIQCLNFGWACSEFIWNYIEVEIQNLSNKVITNMIFFL